MEAWSLCTAKTVFGYVEVVVMKELPAPSNPCGPQSLGRYMCMLPSPLVQLATSRKVT